MVFELGSEAAFCELAGGIARRWAAEPDAGAILVGLKGDLGAGKTTWARAMLAGLGYAGRVPSPTYTLLEHYALERLDVIHVDLYRLGGGEAQADARGEVEALGIRDWLDRDRCWLLVEWPERSPELLARCDVLAEFELGATPEARRLTLSSRTPIGEALLRGLQRLSEIPSS